MPHIHEKIDFTVEVFIVHNGKVLLRKHDKYKQWFGVGGHIELDEDPIQAAVRECKEEVGLDITIIPPPLHFSNTPDTELTPPAFLNRHPINETHEHVGLVYFATSTTDAVTDMEGPEKSLGLKWFTYEELGNSEYGIYPNVIHYARSAITATKSH